MRRRAFTSLPVTGRMAASRGRVAGRGGMLEPLAGAVVDLTGGGGADVSPSPSSSLASWLRIGGAAKGGGADAASVGGVDEEPGGLADLEDGGGAYLGVLAWKKDRMESWAGFDDGRDMMAAESRDGVGGVEGGRKKWRGEEGRRGTGESGKE